jgi:predicted TIM-barrel fold metal-dependent hydrolase
MDRRTFIKTSSLTTVGISCCLRSCNKPPHIPIIDTHQHLWDLELFPLGWVKPPLNRSYLMEDYLEATSGQHVVKAIYMEVGVPEGLRRREAEWVLKVCEDPGNPTVAAVIRADPSQPDFESYITQFEGNPYIKGIRYSLRNTGETIPSTLVSRIRLLGRLGLRMDMNLAADELMKGFQLVDLCPDVHFVLDHCGSADPVSFFPTGRDLPRPPKHDRDQWFRDMELLAQRPNVVCKISGIVDNVPDYPLRASDLSPIIDHCIKVFGPDRVMFGGDWPVCLRNMTLRGWIDLLKEVIRHRPFAQQMKLFHDNALAFYGLAAFG